MLLSSGLRLPSTGLLLVLLGIGLLSTLGQWTMTMAYSRDRAAPVAAAAYVAPVFGFVVDFFAFGVPPSTQALAGGSLVVGAGLST